MSQLFILVFWLIGVAWDKRRIRPAHRGINSKIAPEIKLNGSVSMNPAGSMGWSASLRDVQTGHGTPKPSLLLS